MFTLLLLQVQEKEGEIEVIMEKIRKQAEDMENLVLEKQGLDAEIAVFKKLVETEEERLGVTKGKYIYFAIIPIFSRR